MDKDIKYLLIVMGIVSLSVYGINNIDRSVKFETSTEWQDDYKARLPEDIKSGPYFGDTDYFDYNNPRVKEVAETVKSQSHNSREAVKNALEWTYKNVQYVIEDNDACYTGTASVVIDRGYGQCDTQTMVTASIVRSMGIAVRSVGGCLYSTGDALCNLKFSMMATAGIDPRTPKYQPIDLTKKDEIPRGGGLHLWSEYYDVEEQKWIIMESTTGRVVEDQDCWGYDVEMIVPDGDKQHYCTSTDYNFAQQCALKGG